MKIYGSMVNAYPLWRKALVGKNTWKKEAELVVNILKKNPKIKTVLDLGGGIGLHSNHITKQGYEVTILDNSEEALKIAKLRNPNVKIIRGNFENIDLDQKFDACICMWTTLPYIKNTKDRKNLFQWIKNNINKIILLDQGNFYNYPKKFKKIYAAIEDNFLIKITRSWFMHDNFNRSSTFLQEITNLDSCKTSTFVDQEQVKFISVEDINDHLGDEWKNYSNYGDYSLDQKYNKEKSERLITVHKRK